MALALSLVATGGSLIDHGWQLGADRALLLAMRGGTAHGAPIGPPWLAPAMIGVTMFGDVAVLHVVVWTTAAVLAIARRWLTLALVLGGTISGSLAVFAIKAIVARPRPTVTDHLVTVHDLSFPSGHSANSAIVYLTLAGLIAQITPWRAARRLVTALAVLLVVAIGCSRVYLGVHWPSDVIAGWSFGALWALAWWALGAWIRVRRES